MDKSITLPPDEIFRNLENAKRFAIDIGSRGRAPGAGRRAAGVGAGGGAGGPGAVARTKGGARAADAHILSDLVVRCPPAPVLAAAVGLPLSAGAARPERGMPGLVVPRGEAGGRAAPRWSTSVGSATGRGLCGPREGRGARGVGPRRGVQASGRGNPRRAARPGPALSPPAAASVSGRLTFGGSLEDLDVDLGALAGSPQKLFCAARPSGVPPGPRPASA